MSRRKKSQQWILEHYECEGQLDLEYFGIYDPCAGCMKENCVGCRYFCPEEMEAYNEFMACLNDERSDF